MSLILLNYQAYKIVYYHTFKNYHKYNSKRTIIKVNNITIYIYDIA